jgi:ABC-type sugar transport system, periplasmic component
MGNISKSGACMKYRWISILIIVFFIIAIALIYNTTNFLWNETGLTYHSEDPRNYRFHFVMITRATDEGYWDQAHIGAIMAANNEKVALEYFGPRFLDLKELERFLEIAILSSVDGIMVSVPNDPMIKALIKEAIEKKIPVVALSNDIDDIKQISKVVVNTYDLGYQTGHALTAAVPGDAKVAVLVDSNFSTANHRRYLQGINDALRGHPGLQIKLILTSKGGSISAEEQTQSILTNYPEIQAIICSNASDTLGVSKVVVDLNRVTHVTIIGSGFTAEIANYIKRGVIWGVLTDSPIELGTQGMLTLIRLKEGKASQENYYIPLFLINSGNINVNLGRLNNYEKDEKHAIN